MKQCIGSGGLFSPLQSLNPSFMTLYLVFLILKLSVFYTSVIVNSTPQAESLQVVVNTCCKQNKLLVGTPAHDTEAAVHTSDTFHL